MSNRDALIRDEIEQSERTRDLPLPEGAVGVRKNREKSSVYSLRLPNDAINSLEKLAGERGVPVAALARGFILAGLLEHQRTTISSVIERVQGDLQELKDLIS